MTGVAASRRRSDLGQKALVLLALTAILGTLGLIGLNARLLGQMTNEVQSAEAQTAALNNASREMLRLRQRLTELGETSNPEDLDIQRGLLGRQIKVSEAAYPPGSTETAELEQIWLGVQAFPWARLPARGGHSSPLRTAGVTSLDGLERRLNAIRSAEEKSFYSATITSLAAKRRSQTGLAALVSLVLMLSVATLVTFARRRRHDIAAAYEALKAEVHERRTAEDALRISEGRFRSLVQQASDLTVVTDDRGFIGYLSPAAERTLGLGPDDARPRSLDQHISASHLPAYQDTLVQVAREAGTSRTVELRLHTEEGRERTVEVICQNVMDDPAVRGLVWNGRDVTERRALEDELISQAHHDSLTGLANRALFLDRLQSALADRRTRTSNVSVLLIDLDGFKHVNDTYGHSVGDELLQRAAGRLRDCLRADDTAARLGGDEFALIIRNSSPEQVVSTAARVIETLGRPIDLPGFNITIGASLGIAHPRGGESAHDLLRDADIAMYGAKNAGKNRFEVFEASMRVRSDERTRMQQDLARAVEKGEINAHYQPVVDLETGRIMSFEALARWRHPKRGTVPPLSFIPIAEESGVIVPIGRELLRQACVEAHEWRTTVLGHENVGVAVNVSVVQVISGTLYDHVTEALALSGLPPAALTLEITESGVLEASDAVTAEFTRLKTLGVKIAVDDFGSGYSSLGFLLGLDADTLKIDRSLLDFDTAQEGSLVEAISDLGRTLGLTVIVEGVETAAHLARAQAAHCQAAQGYYFARPMPASAVSGFLAARADAQAVATA